MKLNKKIVVGVVLVCVVLGILILKRLDIKDKVYFLSNSKKEAKLVEAEQSGSSPESGATSKLKSAYDGLVSKGTNYGDSQPADWEFPSYGTYWDRILYAAAWEPDGDATEEDVILGKTFYSGNSRTLKTGTFVVTDYSKQQYQHLVDYATGDYTGEEAVWVQTAASAWKDTRTGLYWSTSRSGTYTNSFSRSTCNFFTTNPRGDYTGTDTDCGQAINVCGTLNLTSGGNSNTDWYLPSQKELVQAYIDGIDSVYHSLGQYWTSTQVYYSSTAAHMCWTGYGYCINQSKDTDHAVRCVRRD